MTELRQAAQWALQYLEANADADSDWEIMIALRKALEQPEQEPVAFINPSGPITQYRIPTQRQWVGLTDEDKKKIATVSGCTEDDDGHIVTEIFRLAEAKLKEKNDH